MGNLDLDGKNVRHLSLIGQSPADCAEMEAKTETYRHLVLRSVLWFSIDEEELTGVAKAGSGAWEGRRLRDAIKQAVLSCSPQLRAQIASRQINWRESVCR